MPPAASRSCLPRAAKRPPSRRRADHAFHQVVHLLELGVGLPALGAGADHGIALVVLDRALEDDVAAGGQLGLDIVGLLARRFRDLRPIGRDLDDAFLQAAAVEVRDALAIAVPRADAVIY